MLLTAFVLFCAVPVSVAGTPQIQPVSSEVRTSALAKTAAERPAVTGHEKPDTPLPKIEPVNESAGEMPSASISHAPTKPAPAESFETPRKKMIWYGLVVAGHGAAVFDAWTTRRAIASGYGVEGDPLQKPFAHSGAIYATTQVTPVLLDYVGRRMMRGRNPWMRRTWWIPEAAGAGFSLGAGTHNYRIVPR